MLTEYIHAAMRRAKYSDLGDEGFAGEIPESRGLLGHGASLEACRDDLVGALESWILVGLWRHDQLPVIDGIDLNIAHQKKDEAA